MLAATRRAFVSIPTLSSKASYATISAAQNGVKIATVEESGPASGLAVVVKGGSRLETGDNAGVAHFLKNYGFKNNANRTAFRITREAEMAGAILSSSLTHESLVYATEFLPGDAELFAEILGDVVSSQKYSPHEFLDVATVTAQESASALSNPEVIALETAHQVAFRSGLGHSVFAKSTSSVNNDAIKAYAQQLFTRDNVALVGVGLSQETVKNFANKYFNLPSGQSSLAESKYYGGDARVDAATPNGHFVVAFDGVALGSNDYAAAQVLRFALGGANVVKNSSGSGALAQAATKVSKDTEIKAFNFGYSDAGLFGVHVSSPSATTASAVSAAAEQLKQFAKGVSSEDLKRGIAQAKFAAVSDSSATRVDLLASLGAEALYTGKYTSVDAALASLDKVSSSDVAKVAEKILKSKPTTVAVGNVNSLPFADSFGF